MSLADVADTEHQPDPNYRFLDRDSRIDLRQGTYLDWMSSKTVPIKIEGLTSGMTEAIISDICRVNNIELTDLVSAVDITFGRSQCILVGPRWRGGWEFRAGSLALKWGAHPVGTSTKGATFRALANCAGTRAQGRAWVGSLTELIQAGIDR